MRQPSTAQGPVALLLFLSGACALCYQTVWLREFRLSFGASTAATAAVLAIFMGGLGVGGLVLGPRVDRQARPLRLYAWLEVGISVLAATTPLLLDWTRLVYVGLGGTESLGTGLGTLLRLVLAALVLAGPTLLMGGTLPAAARAIETDRDPARRGVGLLYGVNTLGAVTGCLLATFAMLEALGSRRTLWLACAVNLIVALVALRLSSRLPRAEIASESEADAAPAAPPGFVLLAAAASGFAFFLMEIVWYRMLGPLLGGTVFTFGLILAVALAGIGTGGTFYYFLVRRRPATLAAFAATCLIEAVCLALPLALGDRIALLSIGLQPHHAAFYALVAGWALVTAIVVLPAAFVAGVQFPLLVALLGRGRRRVGRQVGLAYAWNTTGAIGGALAGGFGLIPALSVPGCWRIVSVLLVLLGLAAALMAARHEKRWRFLLPAGAMAVAVGLLISARGPTAVWRHSNISVRWLPEALSTNALRDWVNNQRAWIVWEVDGVESSVALRAEDGYAFIVNGKTDGNARNDAPTQVMLGMVGALLHADPRRALVIGLGTGSTAGWLASIPEMEHVDVVELEPAVLDVARVCGPVNQNALDNPKVSVRIADARELLLTTPERYDMIVSEPSNPYRAGIASLFTKEYYEAASARLNEGGRFVQWVQVYDVHPQAIRTVVATLATVFPHVEIWQVSSGDLGLIASRHPIEYDGAELQARLGRSPYREALSRAWRAVDLEGLLARRVAGDGISRAIAQEEKDRLNTDDRNLVEFGFARTLGAGMFFRMTDLRETARRYGENIVDVRGTEVDWDRVVDEEPIIAISSGRRSAIEPSLNEVQQHRAQALRLFASENPREALEEWRKQTREPVSPTELALVAEGLAEEGSDRALDYLPGLRAVLPIEADVILSRLHLRQGRTAEAADVLERAFIAHRTDPWPSRFITWRALRLAGEIGSQHADLAMRLFGALERPFCVDILQAERHRARIVLSPAFPSSAACVIAFAPLEPNVPWQEPILRARANCYERAGDPRAGAAARDLADFLAAGAGSPGRSLPAGLLLPLEAAGRLQRLP